jgi:hypothetical protein
LDTKFLFTYFHSIRVWTQCLVLARQPLCLLRHAFFAFRLIFRLPDFGLDHDTTTCCLPCSRDHRHAPQCLVSCWDGVSISFCLGSPQTMILLISASCINSFENWEVIVAKEKLLSHLFFFLLMLSTYVCLYDCHIFGNVS